MTSGKGPTNKAFVAGTSKVLPVVSGSRLGLSRRLPLHMFQDDTGRMGEVAPIIEDPFGPTRDLAAAML